MSINAEIFWENVYDQLRRQGSDPSALAVRIGTSKRHIKKCALLRAVPDAEMVRQIAEALNVTEDELL